MTALQNFEISTKDLNELIKEIFMSHDTVNQFGQNIPNPNLGNHEETLINTFNVIIEISQQIDTYNLNQFGMYEDSLIDLIEENYSEINHVNTYNWNSPLTNDLDFKIFQCDHDQDQYFVVMNVHNGYSDVRCGYNLQIGFFIEQKYFEWVYLFHELDNSMGCFMIEDFCFDFDMFMEHGSYRVYNERLDLDNYDVYIGDYNDCKEWIKNKEYE